MDYNVSGGVEQATKFMEEMNERLWEAYLKGLDEGLNLSKTWTDMLISTLDQSKDTQEKVAAFAEETLKNMREMQTQYRSQYTDTVKKVWEKASAGEWK